MIGGISGQLSALAMESRSLRSEVAEAGVESAQKQREEAEAAAAEAARQAAEAAEDGGFWDDVGSVAGDVALVAGCVAACVVTGGGAAAVIVVAAAAMKMGGRALEAAGVESDITTGMQVVGGIGMAVGGCMTGVGAASALSQGAALVGTGATATQGVAKGAAGKYKKDELDSHADGTAASGKAATAELESSHSLREMQQAVEDDIALEKAAREIEQQIQQHKTRMISQIGGA